MLVPRSKYLKQLDDLSAAMDDLGQKTIADVTAAGLALAKGDTEAAEEVISGEMRMRRLRATIEDTCLDIMLMQQPLVADDLRYVSGSFRLVSDLAHIDSKSRDVAYLATQIPHEAASAIETEIATASGKVAYMVKTALESFADADRESTPKRYLPPTTRSTRFMSALNRWWSTSFARGTPTRRICPSCSWPRSISSAWATMPSASRSGRSSV